MPNRERIVTRRRLLTGTAMVCAAALATASTAARAQSSTGLQGSAAQQEETGARQIEQIVVTGSRIARDDISASVPVTTIDANAFKFSGTLNVETLLNDMPQFVPDQTAASNFPGNGVATIDLRGLGPTRNLVLVNSRRYMIFDGTGVTDINTIPSALIERVEVVTGGSSAVYGSDAITGVTNFILRDDFEGIEARAQANFDSRGDALTSDFSLTAGGNFGEGRGNAVLSVNYLKREPIFRGERDFTAVSAGEGCLPSDVAQNNRIAGVDSLLAVPPGSSCEEQGGVIGLFEQAESVAPNGAFFGFNPNNPEIADALLTAGVNPNEIIPSLGLKGPDAGSTQFTPFQFPQDFFNGSPPQFLQLPQERWTVTGMASYDLNEKVELYAEAAFANNRVKGQLASAVLFGFFNFPVANPQLSPEFQNVFAAIDQNEPLAATRDDGAARLFILRRLQEFGPREVSDSRNSWRVLTGFRGDLGDVGDDFLTNFSYDVYYMFSRTETTRRGANFPSRRFVQEGLQLGSGGPDGAPLVNLFGPNLSEEGAQFIEVDTTTTDEAQMQVVAGSVSGDFFPLPFGTVSGAFGGEWRSTSAVQRPDELLKRGDVPGIFRVGSETQGEIDVWELFGEVRVPLLADLPLIDELTANGGFRYSNYNQDLDNVGEVWTYLGGLDWRFNQDVVFRGQFQRAIRAPNVAELFSGTATERVPATDPCAQSDAATDPDKRAVCIATGVPENLVGDARLQNEPQITGITGGNPELDAEQSDTWTFGAVFTPRWIPGLNIAVDYFDIKLTGAIAPLGGGVNNTLDICFNKLQEIDSEFCQAINRDPVTGQLIDPFFPIVLNANTGKLKVEGVDANIDYSFNLGWGLFDGASSVDLRFNGTWTDKFTQTPVQEFPDEKNLCAGTFGQVCGEPRPEFKLIGRTTWNTGPLSLSLRYRFIDSVKDDRVVVPRRLGQAGPSPSDVARFKIGTQHYFDLSFNYDLLDNVAFFGGANNLFDNKPPLTSVGEQANTFPSTFDVIGTELFLGATVRF